MEWAVWGEEQQGTVHECRISQVPSGPGLSLFSVSVGKTACRRKAFGIVSIDLGALAL